jgi:hypothetical protein
MPLGLFIKRRRVWMPLAFVFVAIAIYAFWPSPKRDPGPPLPSPNGYDDFVKAGRLLPENAPDYSAMTVDELRSLFSTNQEPLRLVRLGLERECRVPTEKSVNYMDKHISDLASLKRLARFLSASGRFVEMEERYDDAAKIHLEVVRLGQASARGGLMLDKLVGVAIENVGLVELDRMHTHLSTESGHTAARTLEELEIGADSAVAFIVREGQSNRNVGWSGRIVFKLLGWLFSKPSFFAAVDQKFTAKVTTSDRRRRQLMLNLAARVYELEHGKRPLSVEELVPSVLRAVPKDPETGTNLVLNPAL